MGKLDQRKIATCCYCGNRSVLDLTARGGHELACGSCGAPLHLMKAMRVDRETAPRRASAAQPARGGMQDLAAAGISLLGSASKSGDKARRKAAKRALKKKFGRGKDLVEDLFDLFD